MLLNPLEVMPKSYMAPVGALRTAGTTAAPGLDGGAMEGDVVLSEMSSLVCEIHRTRGEASGLSSHPLEGCSSWRTTHSFPNKLLFDSLGMIILIQREGRHVNRVALGSTTAQGSLDYPCTKNEKNEY